MLGGLLFMAIMMGGSTEPRSGVPVAGTIGLWTKSDAVTYFDDLRLEQMNTNETMHLPQSTPVTEALHFWLNVTRGSEEQVLIFHFARERQTAG